MQRVSHLGTISLITLIVQNAAVALITRQSRVNTTQATVYRASTVILNQEIVKMIICLIYFAYERRCHQQPTLRLMFSQYWQNLSTVVFNNETWKLAVPAALFTLQNFLIFISLANLDVMTFQMLSQTKLLSAAIFTVWLLHRRLTCVQWLSLFILTLGVILAHVDTRGAAWVAKVFPMLSSSSSSSSSNNNIQHTPAPQPQPQHNNNDDNPTLKNFSWFGVIACIVSGLSSSFAGVYFEKVVKTSAPSLAVRNIHLCLFGIPFALISMLVIDVSHEGISEFQFFRGYSSIVWLLVATHAIGGLVVAVVVKYADNILKGFATAIATVLSGIYAALFWGFFPTVEFVIGCSAVFGSVILFHYAENKSNDSSSDLTSPSSKDGQQPTTPVLVIGGGSGSSGIGTSGIIISKDHETPSPCSPLEKASKTPKLIAKD